MRYDYLAHHGILGQKWGVRRFQNKDGTLTPKGKKRYKTDGSSAQVSSIKNKHIRSLSDERLNASISRLQKEKNLRNLMEEVNHPHRTKTKRIVSRVGNKTLDSIFDTATKEITKSYIHDAMSASKARSNANPFYNQGGKKKKKVKYEIF